ncbi:hypothetical protein E2C01_069803 [Portunus trituberculatus]|uniref:Uncharacterized protein n=1 Tax=Portunus trituberculatus TaxID=210409 RepID=A0A5B7I0E1_PORTR|nr:hypothetical protein [Portunus trituberculatus]
MDNPKCHMDIKAIKYVMNNDVLVTDQPQPPQDNDREDHTAAASPTSHHPSNATEEPVISVSIASSSTVFDCPPPLPSRDSSITTAAIPSTSSAGLSPEDIHPCPKAVAPPRGKGRKRIHACILTENEKAIENLQEKGKKNSVAKKMKSCKTTKKRPQESSSSEDEDNPQVVLDDSFEYSDEADGEAEDQPYPFMQEAEIRDFILVELELEEGRNAGEKVHYVGKVLSIKDDTSYNASFLRIKSKFGIPDNFCFPLIEDTAKVSKEPCKGVLMPQQGCTHDFQIW